jgi:hypothetical protein
MALFKYLTKEKDKLVEGEEFVKANEATTLLCFWQGRIKILKHISS